MVAGSRAGLLRIGSLLVRRRGRRSARTATQTASTAECRTFQFAASRAITDFSALALESTARGRSWTAFDTGSTGSTESGAPCAEARTKAAGLDVPADGGVFAFVEDAVLVGVILFEQALLPDFRIRSGWTLALLFLRGALWPFAARTRLCEGGGSGEHPHRSNQCQYQCSFHSSPFIGCSFRPLRLLLWPSADSVDHVDGNPIGLRVNGLFAG